MNDTLTWLLGDHLGSTSVTANADGTYHSEARFSAFGETRYTHEATMGEGIPTDYLYTGQREESEVGLYYYVARWYDPAIGRFIQADSVVPNLSYAVAWDRYAYVVNNPIILTDPSGHLYCPDYWDPECLEKPDEINSFVSMIRQVGGSLATGGYDVLKLWTSQFFMKPDDKGVRFYKGNNNDFPTLDIVANMVDVANLLYGDDWVNAMSYVILGNVSPKSGPGTYSAASKHNQENPFNFWQNQLHEDFKDTSNQVPHFWAPFANTIGKGGWGGLEASLGAYYHDVFEAAMGHGDATVQDYALSLAAIDLASQINSGGITSTELADLIRSPTGPLGKDGPGSSGLVAEYEATWPWGYMLKDAVKTWPYP